MRIDFLHPANHTVIEYLKNPYRFHDASPPEILQLFCEAREGELKEIKRDQSPESIELPHFNLEAYPRVVARLWDEFTYYLPEDCRWVVYGHPVLVHPKSGIIFAWGQGKEAYALRLPERRRIQALAHGATAVHEFSDTSTKFDLKKIGEEWIFGAWLLGETDWCLEAYNQFDR